MWMMRLEISSAISTLVGFLMLLSIGLAMRELRRF